MLTVFTSPTCPNCRVTKLKLTAANIPFEICEDMEEMAKYNIKQLPFGVLVEDGTEVILSHKDLIALANSKKVKN